MLRPPRYHLPRHLILHNTTLVRKLNFTVIVNKLPYRSQIYSKSRGNIDIFQWRFITKSHNWQNTAIGCLNLWQSPIFSEIYQSSRWICHVICGSRIQYPRGSWIGCVTLKTKCRKCTHNHFLHHFFGQDSRLSAGGYRHQCIPLVTTVVEFAVA